MPTPTETRLLELIDEFLADRLSIAQFWEDFSFLYADASETELSNEHASYLAEVHERLHYTDWSSPSEPPLSSPTELSEWLFQARKRYGGMR